ncbi:MAG TPA: copper chaperone PCu(A)C [Burkholderiaceae bacterium]|jgi:hypothetical protein
MNLKKFTWLALGVSMSALAFNACAQVTVEQAWARATVPQQKVTGAYLRVKSAHDSRLIEVRSTLAGAVQMHEMAMVGDVMKMRELDAVKLPAGQWVEFKPGGYHLMLMDLKKPIAAGDKIPLTLVVEGADKKRQTVEVQAEARALGQ